MNRRPDDHLDEVREQAREAHESIEDRYQEAISSLEEIMRGKPTDTQRDEDE
ncbi:hypothetical protein [Amycolatopsis thermophila]|uniref:Uncharacterized protein n=1 Tax=Amycolatopsis thermophila TaxID=206084 RepID=A0ABU0F311_9PSEU|nr:hypothetical protein [Amycolatopsis thermophila]MDQ0381883.1 hypothetical protein [Amycolatopsis thermophila]